MSPSDAEKRYRVILTDDHQILRLGLRNLIGRDERVEVVGEAGDGRALIDLLRQVPADMVILDLSMPGMNGIKLLETLKLTHPDLKILIFTMHREKEFFRHAMRRGVDGYILKDDDFDRILTAIRDIRSGRKAFSAELMVELAEELSDAPGDPNLSLETLTRREREILARIGGGATSKEIAAELGISFRTVQTHRTNIMEKLGIRNTAGLVKFAVRSRLI